MNKFKIIWKCLMCWFKRDGYPPAFVFRYWTWKWNKRGNVKYLHLHTMVNALRGKVKHKIRKL